MNIPRTLTAAHRAEMMRFIKRGNRSQDILVIVSSMQLVTQPNGIAEYELTPCITGLSFDGWRAMFNKATTICVWGEGNFLVEAANFSEFNRQHAVIRKLVLQFFQRFKLLDTRGEQHPLQRSR